MSAQAAATRFDAVVTSGRCTTPDVCHKHFVRVPFDAARLPFARNRTSIETPGLSELLV
jgi:hypothetical protein